MSEQYSSVAIHVPYSWGSARCECATTPTVIWGTGTVPSPPPPLLTSPCGVARSRHARQQSRCSRLRCGPLSSVLSISLQGCAQTVRHRSLCNPCSESYRLLQPVPPGGTGSFGLISILRSVVFALNLTWMSRRLNSLLMGSERPCIYGSVMAARGLGGGSLSPTGKKFSSQPW